MTEITFISDPLKFLTLQELIPDDLQIKRLKLRAFLQKEVKPEIDQYVEHAEFPKHFIPKLKKLNLLGLEQEGYGCRYLSPVEKALNLYEISRVDGGLETSATKVNGGYLINGSKR